MLLYDNMEYNGKSQNAKCWELLTKDIGRVKEQCIVLHISPCDHVDFHFMLQF